MSKFKNENVVFVQPNQKHTPVRYIDSLEESSMVVIPGEQLAIYTARGVPNTGPQGVPGPPGADGVDQNSWFDTIIAAASDEVTPLTVGGPKTHFRCPYPLVMNTPGYPGYVRISASAAPEGAPLVVDVTMNGVSMFTSLPQIDAGTKTSVASFFPAVLAPAITTIPDDAEFLVYVTAVGSVVAGTGLKVAITGIKG